MFDLLETEKDPASVLFPKNVGGLDAQLSALINVAGLDIDYIVNETGMPFETYVAFDAHALPIQDIPEKIFSRLIEEISRGLERLSKELPEKYSMLYRAKSMDVLWENLLDGPRVFLQEILKAAERVRAEYTRSEIEKIAQARQKFDEAKREAAELLSKIPAQVEKSACQGLEVVFLFRIGPEDLVQNGGTKPKIVDLVGAKAIVARACRDVELNPHLQPNEEDNGHIWFVIDIPQKQREQEIDKDQNPNS